MIKNLDELAKFVKGGAEVLQKAIESEDEMSLEFIDGSFVSDSDLETLKTGQFNAGKKEGHTIGYDIAMKDLKNDFGLEVEGKDRKVIAEALKKHIIADAKIEPDKKINELNQSIENLRKQYDSDLSERDGKIQSYENKFKDMRIMSELERNTPEVKGLKSSQFATLAKTEFEFDFDENGNLFAKKGGTPIKDKMERLIPVKNILTDYATQNGWFGSDGRGGGDNIPGGKSKFETEHELFKFMDENKIDPESTEGKKLITDFKNKN